MNSRKTCTCLYLYSDGHAVACYDKIDREAGRVEYVEIYERIVAERSFLGFKGRIVFHDGDAFLPLLKGARHVTAQVPAIDRGSDATKRKGIAVGGVSILPTKGGELRWNLIPDVLSSGLTYDEAQETYDEPFNPDVTRWGDRNVGKIHRSAQKTAE
jgi:hypothetical protein